jgi:hypothetical protein
MARRDIERSNLHLDDEAMDDLRRRAAKADKRSMFDPAETYMDVARAAEKLGWPKYKP